VASHQDEFLMHNIEIWVLICMQFSPLKAPLGAGGKLAQRSKPPRGIPPATRFTGRHSPAASPPPAAVLETMEEVRQGLLTTFFYKKYKLFY
jgi:hypothetical protein